MCKQWNVGILLFNEVEVLDFAGPYEVFSMASYTECNLKPFQVKTVAQNNHIISARNGLKIQPDYDFGNAPQLFIEEFPIITSGGISAGMDMSFYIIKKLIGEKISETTAKRMEYDLKI